MIGRGAGRNLSKKSQKEIDSRIVKLKEQDGLSWAVIGKRVGMSPANVRARYDKAKAKTVTVVIKPKQGEMKVKEDTAPLPAPSKPAFDPQPAIRKLETACTVLRFRISTYEKCSRYPGAHKLPELKKELPQIEAAIERLQAM